MSWEWDMRQHEDHCRECLSKCRAIEVDYGIGHYDYGGAPGYDSNKQIVSHCCEGGLYDPDEEPEETE